MAQDANDGSLLEFSFISKAASGLPLATLIRLAQRVWSQNTRLRMTGQLHFADGEFQQIIEGPNAALMRMIPAILADPRHESITIQSLRHIERRAYSGWLTSGLGESFPNGAQCMAHWLPRIAPDAVNKLDGPGQFGEMTSRRP